MLLDARLRHLSPSSHARATSRVRCGSPQPAPPDIITELPARAPAALPDARRRTSSVPQVRTARRCRAATEASSFLARDAARIIPRRCRRCVGQISRARWAAASSFGFSGCLTKYTVCLVRSLAKQRRRGAGAGLVQTNVARGAGIVLIPFAGGVFSESDGFVSHIRAGDLVALELYCYGTLFVAKSPALSQAKISE